MEAYIWLLQEEISRHEREVNQREIFAQYEETGSLSSLIEDLFGIRFSFFRTKLTVILFSWLS